MYAEGCKIRYNVIMGITLKNLLLKTIPYLLSVIGGITIFLISLDRVKDPNVSGLIDNIAASLLSIPLVFLLYDYTNYRISKQVNRTLATNISDKVNSVVLNIVVFLRHSLGLKVNVHLETFNKLQDWSIKKIAQRLKITRAEMNNLRAYRYEIDEILYRASRSNVLTSEQTQILSALSREILHLMTEHNFHRDRVIVAKHVRNIILHVIEWQDASATMSAGLEKDMPDDVSDGL